MERNALMKFGEYMSICPTAIFQDNIVNPLFFEKSIAQIYHGCFLYRTGV